ncbi:ATR-interacting protein isoform X5 [Sminthopsis crassicaudata]|uniref:ATR-interacting protein isoform X5 n=1 Tax=Sminthopsis crassicaudata TaxID=9301 RepID=UPI003D68EC95
MAGNSGTRFLGSKKRSTAQLQDLRPPQGRERRDEAPGVSPPTKRSKSLDSTEPPDAEDAFGDHEEFTADDLEEIDIIASQALTQALDCKALNASAAPRSAGPSAGRSSEPSRNGGAPKHAPEIPHYSEQDGMSRSKNPSEKNREKIVAKDISEFEKLKAQHEKLKEKMQAMQEEILIKNGEIKILRDSLHHTESNLEEKKRSHFLLEQEKIQALNDKEKEFSKKLQSLQSELQFKDAEMNELRTKLQNSGKASKATTTLSMSHVSPRKSPSRVTKQEACSPQMGKSSFPTKESFNANTSPPHPCQPSTHPYVLALSHREDSKIHSLGNESVKQEETQRNLTSSCIHQPNTQGSVLINLLLKQPLIPGVSLGLCHLLSSHPEAPAAFFQPPRSDRFQCVLSSHGLLQCLSSTAHLSAVLLTVHLLSLLVDHEKLAPQLCSQSETCLLLLLYMYITSRPDKAVVETQWFQLEQETVWFLAKIMQSPDSPISITGSDCQCSLEVVKALIVMLHRQWLTIRRLEGHVQMGQRKQMVRCLRDTLLLLHSLSQRDTLFHVHCMDVLHQYDQVIPGIQALLQGLPDKTNCEETALEDLCRTEPDLEDSEVDPS